MMSSLFSISRMVQASGFKGRRMAFIRRSFFVFCIDHNGHRPVVEQGQLHIGTEYSSGDGPAELFLKLCHHRLVKREDRFRPCGPDVGGSIAFFCGSKEGELADEKDTALYFLYR